MRIQKVELYYLKEEKTMKKIAKTLFITVLAVAVFMTTSAVVANAQTLYRIVGGANITAECSISRNSASASTVANNGGVKVGVSATYSYIDTSTKTIETKSGGQTDNYAGANASFSISSEDISYDISAYHEASFAGETWTGGHTSETYYK